jgi:hypothetical protein
MADDFPYELFSFSSSVASVPTSLTPDLQLLEPGYHMRAGMPLELVIAASSSRSLPGIGSECNSASANRSPAFACARSAGAWIRGRADGTLAYAQRQ